MNLFVKIGLLVALVFCGSTSIAQGIFSLNPIGVGLTLGQWLMKDSQRIYYIQVQASGPNVELAKQEGLRYAVNQAVGTLILAESQVKNQEVVRNDFTQYSSGYIEEFKILNQEMVGGQTLLVMDVWVGESKIANRLFSIGKGEAEINGGLVSAQYQSVVAERIQGDQLLSAVANDFPEKSFDLKMGKLKWRMVERNAEILVPVEMSWSHAYLDAMHEVLLKTRNANTSANQRYAKSWPAVVSLKRSGDWFTTYAAYADAKKAEALKERMIHSKPSIQILIKNGAGDTVYSLCATIPYLSGAFFGESLAFGIYPAEKFGYPTGQFFASHTPDADFSIYGDFKVNTTFSLPIRNTKSEVLNAMESIEINVVPKSQCERQKAQVI